MQGIGIEVQGFGFWVVTALLQAKIFSHLDPEPEILNPTCAMGLRTLPARPWKLQNGKESPKP